MHTVDLPQPTSDEIQHSEQLIEFIAHEIQAAGGWIDFARYMALALYAPGLGYYSGGLQKFGARGDFITAPEVSPLFARTLASPVAKVLSGMIDADVLEFGAGSGVLAAELLLTLEQLNQLPQHYYIIELSAELKQRQHQTILQRAPHLIKHVHWLDALPQQPIKAVVIANEVLDAMPVQRFIKTDSGCEVLGVVYQQKQLAFQTRKCSQALQQQVQYIEQDIGRELAQAYTSEINLNIAPWLQSVSDVLSQGVVLLIDYGYARKEYYLPERSMGTLMCYYRHRAHDDALWYPGLQDITAFVDFTSVAEAAISADFVLEGFTSQAGFLMENGVVEFAKPSSQDDQVTRLKLAQQMKTLLLPSEMGERFKVMGLSKNIDQVVPGFSQTDLTSRL